MWPFTKRKPVEVYQIHELYVKPPETPGGPLAVKLRLQFIKNTSARMEVVAGWIEDAELARLAGASSPRLVLDCPFWQEGGVAMTRPRENSGLVPLSWSGSLTEGAAVLERLRAGEFDIGFRCQDGSEFACRVAKKLVAGRNVRHKYSEEGVS